MKTISRSTLKLLSITFSILAINILLIIVLANFLYAQNLMTSRQPYPLPLKHQNLKYADVNITKIFALTIRYLINNECAVKFQPKIIWVVTSYYAHVELRSAHRRSYSASLLQELGIRRVFLLAQSRKQEIPQSAVNHENVRYSDLVQGDFLEDYRNLTYKHIMGLQWALNNCRNLKYIIKMDDDIVVNLFELLSLLDNYEGKITLMGYVMTHMEVIRREVNKWFVREHEFSRSEYPSFLSGWLYISTPETISKLLSFTNEIPYFWIDDVYVTGLLAERGLVAHQRINEKFTTDHGFINCCMKYDFICDVFVGPNGGDNNLQVEFFKYAEKCRSNKCPRAPGNFSVKKNCVLPYEPKKFFQGKASVDILT